MIEDACLVIFYTTVRYCRAQDMIDRSIFTLSFKAREIKGTFIHHNLKSRSSFMHQYCNQIIQDLPLGGVDNLFWPDGRPESVPIQGLEFRADGSCRRLFSNGLGLKWLEHGAAPEFSARCEFVPYWDGIDLQPLINVRREPPSPSTKYRVLSSRQHYLE